MSNTLEVILSMRDQMTPGFVRAEANFMRFQRQMKAAWNEIATIPNLVAAAAIVKVGTDFVNAGMMIGRFRRQLEMVEGSAERASAALAGIREFARTSPLETEDVTQAFVRMRAVGIDPTEKQMRTLGGVALLFNRKMTDVLDGFVGMNKRTLREYGIEIDRVGEKVVISSGNMRIETDKTASSIRAGLLEVWEKRFPNAMDKASDSIGANIAILKSNLFEFKADISEMFLDDLKQGFASLNSAMDSLRNNMGSVRLAIQAVATPVVILWNGFQIAADTIVAGSMQIYRIGKIVWIGLSEMILGVVDTLAMFAKAYDRATFGDVVGAWKGIQQDYGSITDRMRKMVKGVGDEWKEVWSIGQEWLASTDKDLDDIADQYVRVAQAMENVNQKMPTGAGGITGSGFLGGGAGGDDSPAAKMRGMTGRDRDQSFSMIGAVAGVREGEGFGLKGPGFKGFEVPSGLGVMINPMVEAQTYLVNVTRRAQEEIYEANLETMHKTAEAMRENEDVKMLLVNAAALRRVTAEQQLADRIVAVENHIADSKIAAGMRTAAGMAANMATIAKASRASAVMQKRIAQGGALINTYFAATQAYAEGLKAGGLVGLILGPAAAALAIGAGLGNVAMIERQSFAGGGYQRPGWALVGERGPELRYFREPGYIYTAGESSRMMRDAQPGSQAATQPLVVHLHDHRGGLVDTIRAQVRSGEAHDLVREFKDAMAAV